MQNSQNHSTVQTESANVLRYHIPRYHSFAHSPRWLVPTGRLEIRIYDRMDYSDNNTIMDVSSLLLVPSYSAHITLMLDDEYDVDAIIERMFRIEDRRMHWPGFVSTSSWDSDDDDQVIQRVPSPAAAADHQEEGPVLPPPPAAAAEEGPVLHQHEPSPESPSPPSSPLPSPPEGVVDEVLGDGCEGIRCRVCLINTCNTILQPCMHVFCTRCAYTIRYCSICRGRIELRKRFFF